MKGNFYQMETHTYYIFRNISRPISKGKNIMKLYCDLIFSTFKKIEPIKLVRHGSSHCSLSHPPIPSPAPGHPRPLRSPAYYRLYRRELAFLNDTTIPSQSYSILWESAP